MAALAKKHGLTYHLYPFLQANIKTYFAMRETAQQVYMYAVVHVCRLLCV